MKISAPLQWHVWTFFVGTVLLSIGCAPPHTEPITSRIPVPNYHNLSTQQVLKSVQHWEIIAQEVADKVEETIKKSALLYDKTMYVSMSGNSEFSKAFHSYLVTALLERGIRVSNISSNNIILGYDTQLIVHKADWPPYNKRVIDIAPEFNIPYFMKYYGLENDQKMARKLTRKAYLTGILNSSTFDEAIITCSLLYQDEYISRFSKSYYTEKSDERMYKMKMVNRKNSIKTFYLTE